MKRLIYLIISNPFSLLILIKLWLVFAILKLKGLKTVVYNMHQDYFFDLFKDIYKELGKNGVEVYFSIPENSDQLKEYLLIEGLVPENHILSNEVSPFLPFNMFICAEVTGPDFPFKLFKKTKKIEIYHGTGVYNLYEKSDVLSRFDIHFAIGPQFREFLITAYEKFPREHRIYDVGYPKTDRVFNEPDMKLIRKYNPDKKTVILYAPHWNRLGSIHAFKEEIIELLASFDTQVLIKPHNYLYTEFPDTDWKKIFADLEMNHSNIRFVNEADTQLMYPFTDIMVTDTGTTAAFEFSLLHKPLAVYREDLWFNKKEHIEIEKAIVDTAFCFTSLKELKNVLNDLFSSEKNSNVEDQKIKQKRMTQKYLYNIGNATETACKIILKELGTRK
jgi:hypothetical protein